METPSTKNDGFGSLTERLVAAMLIPLSTMGFAHDLATGDIDGDGDIDIWMADRLFENDGSGNFEISKYLSDIVAQPDGYAMSSLIADFDDDGIGDLVVGLSLIHI